MTGVLQRPVRARVFYTVFRGPRVFDNYRAIAGRGRGIGAFRVTLVPRGDVTSASRAGTRGPRLRRAAVDTFPLHRLYACAVRGAPACTTSSCAPSTLVRALRAPAKAAQAPGCQPRAARAAPAPARAPYPRAARATVRPRRARVVGAGRPRWAAPRAPGAGHPRQVAMRAPGAGRPSAESVQPGTQPMSSRRARRRGGRGCCAQPPSAVHCLRCTGTRGSPGRWTHSSLARPGGRRTDRAPCRRYRGGAQSAGRGAN